jgi:hypothetical protein
MFPRLTDFFALAGIAVVLCAACLLLPGMTAGPERRATTKGRWLAGGCLMAMCFPVGSAMLPIAAYVRGITSDLSISLVVLAGISLGNSLFALRFTERRERMSVFFAGACAALVLYPFALGLGNWDAYSPGWGSIGLWAILLMVGVVGLVLELRLLPLLISLALVSWTVGLLESTNLWDYLLDPWLACVSLLWTFRFGARQLSLRLAATKS